MVRIAPQPLYFKLVQQVRTTRFHVLFFILEAARNGYLRRGTPPPLSYIILTSTGDTLILDNASIHTARDVQPLLRALGVAVGFRIVRLPTYSPELNPCELIFGIVKTALSRYAATQNVVVEVILALARILPRHVYKIFVHCIFRS